MKFRDLSGMTFSRLTVLHRVASDNGAMWRCRCICGAEKSARGARLISGYIQSCGCLQRENVRTMVRFRRTYRRSGVTKPKDLTGQTFGRLTAQRRTSEGKWQCLCQCGNTCFVNAGNMYPGPKGTKSCGCLNRESRTARARHMNKVVAESTQPKYDCAALLTALGY